MSVAPLARMSMSPNDFTPTFLQYRRIMAPMPSAVYPPTSQIVHQELRQSRHLAPGKHR
jgi:hypothetical protein